METIQITHGTHAGIISAVRRASRAAGTRTFIVGGLLRDALTGRESDNLDFLVLEPEGDAAVARLLHETEGFPPPVFFKNFGTWRTFRDTMEIEIVHPRAGCATLEEDLRRRDFTVNTLTACLDDASEDGALLQAQDVLGCALDDMTRRILRTPLDAAITLEEDPLRAMRAVRFASTLGYAMEESLTEAIRARASSLERVAVERIRMELERILLSTPPSAGLAMMRDLGLLRHVIPELAPAVGHLQKSPYHHQDVFSHCLAAMDACEGDMVLRLAALFHDAGKVEAETQVEERTVYYGHQKISAAKARAFMSRLRFSQNDTEAVISLIDAHMVNYNAEWKDSTVKRLMRKMGPLFPRLIALMKADTGALRPPHNAMTQYEDLFRRAEAIHLQDIRALTSPLDGREIADLLGIPPGPAVGRAKEGIINAIIDGDIPNTRDAARAWLLSTFATREQGDDRS